MWERAPSMSACIYIHARVCVCVNYLYVFSRRVNGCGRSVASSTRGTNQPTAWCSCRLTHEISVSGVIRRSGVGVAREFTVPRDSLTWFSHNIVVHCTLRVCHAFSVFAFTSFFLLWTSYNLLLYIYILLFCEFKRWLYIHHLHKVFF